MPRLRARNRGIALFGTLLARLRHGLERRSRNHDRLHATIYHHVTALQIGVPGTLGRVQCVRPRVTRLPSLACKITNSHCDYLDFLVLIASRWL